MLCSKCKCGLECALYCYAVEYIGRPEWHLGGSGGRMHLFACALFVCTYMHVFVCVSQITYVRVSTSINVVHVSADCRDTRNMCTCVREHALHVCCAMKWDCYCSYTVSVFVRASYMHPYICFCVNVMSFCGNRNRRVESARQHNSTTWHCNTLA